MKGQIFKKRLGFALKGLRSAYARERSFRTHLWATAAVILMLVVLRPAVMWWAMLALSVGLVLVTELLNSALEALVDHVHPDARPEIGTVKDIAAGAVLVASLIAVAVGAACVINQIETWK